jgi:CubicO group peptidase (beta-lactamase class C family)
MKIKSYKTFYILMLLALLVMAVVQPALASAPGYRNGQAHSSTHLSGPTDPADFEAFFDTYLAEQMEAYHIPGVVFTMVKDGEVFFSKGYGFADLEKHAPMDPEETVLLNASLAKAFTAVGVLQLNERGLIDLHEDVRPYFTEFPLETNFDEPLTFANLLTNTDGFESRMIGMGTRTEDDLLPLGGLLETYAPDQLYPPGAYMTYQDYASNLSGYLTQEISGVPFEQYMAENILLPLGMTSSVLSQSTPEEFRSRLIVGYEYEDGRQVPVEWNYTRYAPGGGLRTTAADMNRFMLALLNGGQYGGARILSPDSVEMMFTQQFTPHPKLVGISYGLFEYLENGRQLFLRDGDGVGTRSRMVLFPAQDLGFFISYNSDDSVLRQDIISAFLAEFYPAAGSTASIPMEGYQPRASQFSGTYRSFQMDVTTFAKFMFFFSQLLDVTATEEGYLRISSTGLFGAEDDAMGGFNRTSLWVEVEPLYFERVDGVGQIAFVQDESGRIIQMVSGQGYHSTFDKLAWYEARPVQIVLIALAAILILTMLISTFVFWPLGAVIRRLRKQSAHKPVSWGAAAARLWAALVGGMLLLFIFRCVGVLLGGMTPAFVWGVTPDMVEVLQSMYLPVILALALPVFTTLAWMKGWWTLRTRVHYTLVTLAVFAGIWWANYWNLIGFRM